jgi:hypothetical protein
MEYAFLKIEKNEGFSSKKWGVIPILLNFKNSIPSMAYASVKSFMKKLASIPKQEKRGSLGWLELELRGGSAQARKRGGGRLWDRSRETSS